MFFRDCFERMETYLWTRYISEFIVTVYLCFICFLCRIRRKSYFILFIFFFFFVDVDFNFLHAHVLCRESSFVEETNKKINEN